MHAPVKAALLVFLSAVFASGIAHSETTRFENKFVTVKPWIAIAAYGYSLKSIDTGSELKWNPNTRASTGFDFYFHGFFGFGIGGLTELKSEDRLLKGDTNTTDLRFSLAFRSFQVIANYQDIKGFYLENSEFLNPARAPGDPYYQQPDMTSSNKSVLFTWILDPSKYSLEAATDQSVRQSSEGGSWLIGASVSQGRFTNTSPLVPSAVAGSFGVDSGVTSADFTSLTARGGYGHTFVLQEKWFTTLQGLLGLGPQFAHYTDASGTREDSRIVPKFDFLLSGGYNGDQYLSGLMLDFDSTNYKTTSLDIPVTLANLKLYFGARF